MTAPLADRLRFYSPVQLLFRRVTGDLGLDGRRELWWKRSG